MLSDYSSLSSDDSESMSSRCNLPFSVSSRSAFQPTLSARTSSNNNQQRDPRDQPGTSSQTELSAFPPLNPPNSSDIARTLEENNTLHRITRTSRLIRDHRPSQFNFNIFFEAFQHYLDAENTGNVENAENVENAPHAENADNAENDNENAEEQSENGYWLLEENSNSDSNHEDQSGGASAVLSALQRAVRGRNSRWIPLGSSSRSTETPSVPSRIQVSSILKNRYFLNELL